MRKAQYHFRLETWHKVSLYVLVLAMVLTGLAWLLAHYVLSVVNEYGIVRHPLEHWAMLVHGAVIVPTSFLIGAMLMPHIRRAHRAHINRASGWLMLALLACLVFSGYVLYYLASETSRPWWSLAHWLSGCALPIGLVWHIVRGRSKLKS